jgi:superfamily II DNA/RNA helicase
VHIHTKENMTFAEIGLHPAVLKALTDSGYTEPTPVQAQAIPAALEGRDLMVSSQTGSGKTAAFMLPALHRFASQERSLPPLARRRIRKRRPHRGRGRDRPRFTPAQPKMLVLTPTRELALQVTAPPRSTAASCVSLKAVAILGGMPYPKQMELLARNPEILVATPGRLIDHMNSGKIDFLATADAGAGRSRPHAGHGLHRRHRDHRCGHPGLRARPCCSRPRSTALSVAWRSA